MEEKLMASAFYDMGLRLQRNAVESRLSTLSQVVVQSIMNEVGALSPHIYSLIRIINYTVWAFWGLLGQLRNL